MRLLFLHVRQRVQLEDFPLLKFPVHVFSLLSSSGSASSETYSRHRFHLYLSLRCSIAAVEPNNFTSVLSRYTSLLEKESGLSGLKGAGLITNRRSR
jgi:hypothetical protein